MRRARSMAVAAVLAVAVAVGCGSDDASEQSGESTLTQRQYTELVGLYRAMLPFEDVGDSPARVRRTAKRASAACAKVDRDDRLLAAMVDDCEDLLAAFAALAAQSCTSASTCFRLTKTAADVMTDLAATTRASRATVIEEVADADCQDALMSAEEVDTTGAAARAFARAARAYSAGDQAAIKTAAKDVEKANTRFAALPSAPEQLRTLRRECRPAS